MENTEEFIQIGIAYFNKKKLFFHTGKVESIKDSGYAGWRELQVNGKKFLIHVNHNSPINEGQEVEVIYDQDAEVVQLRLLPKEAKFD